jgi:8-oxo-dGTP pyrophosphatase MutT (NUDIX family)
MTWAPHVTVATIIERDNRFLMVYEEADGKLVYNQPAGHLDPDETLHQAAIRETLEETGWTVKLTGVVGVNLYTAPSNGITYFRTTFIGEAISHDANRLLDTGIIEAVWLTYEELLERKDQLRSPMTLQIVEEYRAGRRFSLEVVG